MQHWMRMQKCAERTVSNLHNLPLCYHSWIPFFRSVCTVVNAQGGYSGFQVTGMSEWSQKSIPKKIPRASSKTPKNPWTKNNIDPPQKNPMPILWPLKVSERGNAITQRKTLEIEHSCLFIHHTIWIYPFPHLILFNTPKKSLLKSSYPSQIFVPKKIPESKISNPKKILRSSPSLEILSTPPGRQCHCILFICLKCPFLVDVTPFSDRECCILQ